MVFLGLLLFGMPIGFALGYAALVGLFVLKTLKLRDFPALS